MNRNLLLILIMLIVIISVGCNKRVKNNEPIQIDVNENLSQDIKQISGEYEVQEGTIKSILPFIPEGWKIVEAFGGEIVKGDLNNDSIPDIAFVIEEISKDEFAAPRTLMIITGNKNGTYTLAVKAEDAVRRADEGGIMGEPFMGLEIDKGSLLINHYGGSAWRWSSTYRFQFQEDGWYLIGVTEDWFHAVSDAGRMYEDINLLTGDYIKIETDDNGKEKRIDGNRGVKALINLLDFDVNDERQF